MDKKKNLFMDKKSFNGHEEFSMDKKNFLMDKRNFDRQDEF